MKKAYILLLAALIGLIGMSPLSAKSPADGEETPPFLAAVKQREKWGAVNADGKVVIPFSYDRLSLSLLDEKARDSDLESAPYRRNFVEVKQGKVYGFYNRKGNVLIPPSYTSRSLWKEHRIAVADEKTKIAFYSDEGRQLTPYRYEEASDFKNGAALVKRAGKYGFISKDGQEIDPIYTEAHLFENGTAVVREKQLWGVIDISGKYIIPPIYKDAGERFSDGLLAIKDKNDLWGFVNINNMPVIPPAYRAVIPIFEEHVTAVQNEDAQWGFVNSQGSLLASPQFDAVYTPFREGLAAVKTKDGKAYVHTDGSVAFMADFDKIYAFKNGMAEFREGEYIPRTDGFSMSIGFGWGHGIHGYFPHRRFGWGLGFPFWLIHPWYDGFFDDADIRVKRGYLDSSGKIIAAASNDAVYPATDKGILVFNNDRYGWINRDGHYAAHTIYRELIPISDANLLLARNKEKKWGALSIDDGTEYLPFVYDAITYQGNGYLAAKENGLWLLLSPAGAKLTEPIYQSVGMYGEGLFPVKKNGTWLYLDANGREALTFSDKVEAATAFSHNRAGIKVKGKWALIDRTGQFIIPPTYNELTIL